MRDSTNSKISHVSMLPRSAVFAERKAVRRYISAMLPFQMETIAIATN